MGGEREREVSCAAAGPPADTRNPLLPLPRRRYSRRQQASRKYRGQLRNLRHLLNSLTERVGNTTEKAHLEELRQLKNVAFVITGTVVFF